jgi:type IV pilus assembly protein PilO
MGARHADRIWMFAGATVIVLFAVASWFLLISPKYSDANEVRSQTAATQIQLVTLRTRINELKKEQAQIDSLTAEFEKKKTALPPDSGLPAFLNQLQKAGAATQVNVTGVSVGVPVQQVGLNSVWVLPIMLTADGGAQDMGRFITTLQTGQTRAVLIKSAGVNPESGSTSANGAAAKTVSVSLALNAFVAPPAGSGTPSITTK